MIITWDNAKRLANLDKHGMDFAALNVDFFIDSLVIPTRAPRFKAIGQHQDLAIIVVIFAPLGTEAVSVISMRPASAKEKELVHDR